MHGNPILLDFNWSNSNCMVATNDFDSEMWKNITPVKENAWPKRNPTLEVSSIFQSNSAPPSPRLLCVVEITQAEDTADRREKEPFAILLVVIIGL